ncbi:MULTISPECIES: alpha-glucosidase family protein [Kordiimonas]|jgi:alpha-glucosidase|uniref:alpha-glucosidase family protein n=1 Tax=Kordiimonas TaxID=288021 RepID=UPI00257C1786|nr:alpha-glucosidase family protein [Kordiimonas sp. UBA4487]
MALAQHNKSDNNVVGQAQADTDWWRGAVIYQVYPRSFKDASGDGVGDLKGITGKLDHIASLGVDGIWLSPFFTSPMKDFGYDVADFCDVDPIFGTLADFDALLARAHALGLKVIIDQVYSHTSDQHPWFKESRKGRAGDKADWYVWADAKEDGSAPSNWMSVFMGSSWAWDAHRGQYYLHNFLESQPDLNVHNPAVQDALLEAGRFWLDRGVDGFRMDAVNFMMHDPEFRDNPPAYEYRGDKPFDLQEHLYNQSHADIPKFLARVRAMMNEYPGTFTVAEVGGERALEEMQLFTRGDQGLNTAYSFEFLEADTLSARVIREAVEAWPDTPGMGWPSFTFSNHDRPRAVSRWALDTQTEDNPAFAKMLNMLILSLRGSVCLYQGEELGLPQAHVPFERLTDPEAIANWPSTLGRDGTRTPMPWDAADEHAGFSSHDPWLPVDPRHAARAVSVQEGDEASVLNALRAFLAFRKTQPALVKGSIRFLDAPEPVLAFERTHESETLTCVFNLSAVPQDWSGDTYGVSLFSLEGAEPGKPLPPHGAYCLRQG